MIPNDRKNQLTILRAGRRVLLCSLISIPVLLLLVLPACHKDSTNYILQKEAAPYSFSLFSWHLKNVPTKLLSFTSNTVLLPAQNMRDTFLNDYFQLQSEIMELERDLVRMAANSSGSAEIAILETMLQEMRFKRSSLSPKIESIIEQDIQKVVVDTGVGLRLARRNYTFPPVLFVFQKPPRLLVASPRDRIERLADGLLIPNMTPGEIEQVENRLSHYENLSTIVVNLGGIASYPSMVSEDSTLHRSLFVTTHEWAHQYLFFYPLGQAYFEGGIGQEINEAVADIIGYEIADLVYRSYGYDPPPRKSPPLETGFDFNAEMRKTRLVAERMLDEGRIDEAEQYMEERRQKFVQAGYNIRKLNQAYFAFHGTYAFDPASVSPISDQLGELRSYYDTLGEFVIEAREIRTHEQLLTLLEQKRAVCYNSKDTGQALDHPTFHAIPTGGRSE